MDDNVVYELSTIDTLRNMLKQEAILSFQAVCTSSPIINTLKIKYNQDTR